MFNQDNIVYAIPIDDTQTFEFENVNKCTKAIAYRRTIKWFSGVDLFMNLVLSFFWWPGFILALFAGCGFYGAKNYNSFALIVYVFHNSINIINNLFILSQLNTIFMSLYTSLTIVFLFYAACITCKLIKIIHTITNEDLQKLRDTLARPNVFLWY